MNRFLIRSIPAFLLLLTACRQDASFAKPPTPAPAPAPAVSFEVDPQLDARPISRFIYGINQFHNYVDGLTGPYSNLTFTRLGGNRSTAYNWTNNASNAGSDFFFHNDDYLVSGDAFKGIENTPGGALMPTIDTAFQHNAALLLTIPIAGYVAADKTPPDDVHKSGPNYLQTRFKPSRPRKNAPFDLWPDPNSPIVYQDEFVNWVKTKYPYAQSDIHHPIWFSMDNEPDWWIQTHSEIHPQAATYDELVDDTIAYASAVKDVLDSSTIFGPVNYGWFGYIRLQGAADAAGRDFQEYYLQRMAAAGKAQGRRLLDVLDVHWYPEATGDGVRITGPQTNSSPAVVAARVQAPRSLWDPTYSETSWITHDSTGGPICLIPLLRAKIDKCYPGTRLSISEYNYGGGGDISGGIAQADVLGIFGREGLFASALWPDMTPMPFIGGAFEMYRNFDGKNATFGDVSIHAASSDIEKCSIYASVDSQTGRIILVIINKTPHPLTSRLHLHNADDFTRADIYQLTAASPDPSPAGAMPIGPNHDLDYTMPAFSVTTLSLSQPAEAP